MNESSFCEYDLPSLVEGICKNSQSLSRDSRVREPRFIGSSLNYYAERAPKTSYHKIDQYQTHDKSNCFHIGFQSGTFKNRLSHRGPNDKTEPDEDAMVHFVHEFG